MKKNKESPGDDRLTALFFSRDEEAIRLTEQKYGGYLFSVAGRFLRDRSDCEECVNDALLGAWNSIPPNKPTDMRAYLSAITRRIASNRAEAKRAEKRHAGEYAAALEELEEILPGGGSVEQAYEARMISRILEKWLANARQRPKYIFMARFWYGCSLKEIARELHCSLSTVNKELSSLKAELKELFGSEGINV